MSSPGSSRPAAIWRRAPRTSSGAVAVLGGAGLTVLVEPLNRSDYPGYVVTTPA